MFIILFSIACNDISMKLLFEKIPYIHRKELFSTYTTITHDKCRFGLELISELTKSFRILFGITLHLDGNDCSLLTKNEINLVGKFTPIEHFNAMNKSLNPTPSLQPHSNLISSEFHRLQE